MCPINLSPGSAFDFCRQFLQKCLGDDFGSDPETLGISDICQSQPFLRSVGGNLCEGHMSKGEPSSDEDEDEVLAKRSRQKLQVGSTFLRVLHLRKCAFNKPQLCNVLKSMSSMSFGRPRSFTMLLCDI